MKCPHLKTSKYLKKMRKNDMEDDIIFIKQVPVHPRDRLARATQKKPNKRGYVYETSTFSSKI